MNPLVALLGGCCLKMPGYSSLKGFAASLVLGTSLFYLVDDPGLPKTGRTPEPTLHQPFLFKAAPIFTLRHRYRSFCFP